VPLNFIFVPRLDPNIEEKNHLSNNAQLCHPIAGRIQTESQGENMDHNESLRKFAHILEREAAHAHEAAIEIEGLAHLLPEKSQSFAHLQIKASHKLAKDLRELAQNIKND
jgi:hypothetical protein